MFIHRALGCTISSLAAGCLIFIGCEREVASLSPVANDQASLLKDAGVAAGLAAVRGATAAFHRVEVAQSAGYDLVPGLDHCFNNPGVGGMGYHYINVAGLDTLVDMLSPEAMVYHSGPNGQLVLGAVEYIVPAALWDPGHSGPPMVLGQQMHLNQTLGVYVLHAWIWTNNPSGIFEDWNPRVTCP